MSEFSIKLEVNIPGEVPDGTYVHCFYYEFSSDLYEEIVRTATRMVGNIVSDRIFRAATLDLPKS